VDDADFAGRSAPEIAERFAMLRALLPDRGA
jgi:hypothetical protein